MIRQMIFRRIRSTRVLTTVALCAVLALIAVVTFYPERPSQAASHRRQQLTFEERVAA